MPQRTNIRYENRGNGSTIGGVAREGLGLPRHHRCMCFENVFQRFYELLISGSRVKPSSVSYRVSFALRPALSKYLRVHQKRIGVSGLWFVFRVRSASNRLIKQIRQIIRIGVHTFKGLSIFFPLIIHARLSTRRHAALCTPSTGHHYTATSTNPINARLLSQWISSLSQTRF